MSPGLDSRAVRRSLWFWGVAFVVGLGLLGAASCGGDDDGGGASTTTTEKKQGGTLKINLAADTDHVDPALAYYQVSVQFLYSACTMLLNYPDTAGPQGSRLQPEVAQELPKVSADGKTYTFIVREGFKLSPPSNEAVTADTFRAVIERNLSSKLQSPSASFISDIEGATAFTEGKAKSVSGVTVAGNKLTVKLTKPAPDFLARIAMWFFCAIPKDTPVDPDQERPVPTAGPYHVTSWTPKRQLILKRNPNYTGDRPHNVDEIRYTADVEQATSVLQIRSGSTDYAADGIPPTSNAELAREFGPDSEAAKNDKQQFFYNPALQFNYLGLNTQRPLFADVNVRKAVAYAIDRPALVRLSGAFSGEPSDQYLPPGLPAYEDADLFPLDGPDVEKAKELMGGKTGKAVMYTCNQSPCPERAQLVQQNLKAIGIDVAIKQWPRNVQFAKEGIKGEPFDIADEGWIADYPDPYDFINKLLDGRTIQNSNNVNFSYFNDPAYNKKMDEAASLTGDARNRAYAELDADIAGNAAPLAAWSVPNNIDFFSSRVGCQLFQPVYFMDLGALCLRE
jgi:ABC-type oligopeptide transport system substrate-binding subunit